jgi:hypothetical protein
VRNSEVLQAIGLGVNRFLEGMFTRRLDADDLTSNDRMAFGRSRSRWGSPYPDWWWGNVQAPRGLRRKPGRILWRVSLEVGLSYSEAMLDALLEKPYLASNDGSRICITDLVLYTTIHEAHENSGASSLSRSSAGPVDQQMIDENSGYAWNLLSWFLLPFWLESLFSMCDFRGLKGGDIHGWANPGPAASKHADVMLLMLMVKRGDLDATEYGGFSDPLRASLAGFAAVADLEAWKMKPDRFLT